MNNLPHIYPSCPLAKLPNSLSFCNKTVNHLKKHFKFKMIHCFSQKPKLLGKDGIMHEGTLNCPDLFLMDNLPHICPLCPKLSSSVWDKW